MEPGENHFLDFFENIGLVILLVDANQGIIVDANPAAAKYYGYDRAQLTNMPIRQINTLPLDEWQHAIQLAQHNECNRFDFPHRLASGEVRDVEVYSHPLTLKGQTLLFSIVHDVTEHKRAFDEMQLQSSITSNAAEGIVLIRASDNQILYANHHFNKLFGYASGELIGQPISIINAVGEISPEETTRKIIASVRNDGVWSGEIFNRKKDGSTFWTYAHISSFDSPRHGKLWVSYQSDITARKQAEDKLKVQADMLELAHDSIIGRDMDSRITYWNSGASERYGWSRTEAIGCVIQELLKTQFPVPEEDIHATLLSTGRWEGELTHTKKDGTQIIVASRWQLHYKNGMPISLLEINNDITARKQLEKELELQAHTDYLTGINNRRRFMQIAELELARAVRYDNALSFLMIDIDFFKRINDTYGHQFGDQVLVKLAEICSQVLREIDIIGRYGGEEFVVMLPQTGMEAACASADRLRSVIAEAAIPLERGLPVHFTVSIGVSSLSGKDDNLDWLLNQADEALYAAKNAGRNRVMAAPAK